MTAIDERNPNGIRTESTPLYRYTTDTRQIHATTRHPVEETHGHTDALAIARAGASA